MSPTSWGAYLAGRVAADLVVACGKPGEQSPELVSNRIDGILRGLDPTCAVVVGAGWCPCGGPADCPTGSCDARGRCTGRTCALGGECPRGACAFPAPDYLLVLEGYNDSGMGGPHAPDCTGTGGAQDLSDVPTPCDPTGKLCSDMPCVADGDCRAISARAECFGYQTISLGTFGVDAGCFDGNGTCTVRSAACRTDGDCPVAGQRCVPPGTVSDPVPLGSCRCDDDAQCPDGYRCRGGRCRKACASKRECGAHCVQRGGEQLYCVDPDGRFTAIPCTRHGKDRDRCGPERACFPRPCAEDADCPAEGGSCSDRERCDAGVCSGRCTCPSDVRACRDDRDCGVVRIRNLSIEREYGGFCDPATGRCQCTGRNACRLDPRCHAQYLRHWYRTDGGLIAIRALAKVAERAAAAPGPPLFIPLTLPATNIAECGGAYGDQTYYAKVSAWLIASYRHVIDARSAARRHDPRVLHVDAVHFSATGAQVVGAAAADYLVTLNVCRDGRSGEAQRYCRRGDRWTVTPCGADRECGGGICALRRCTCRTDADCAANGGGACDAGVCPGACPAPDDACHPE